jgi:hypothetical protein
MRSRGLEILRITVSDFERDINHVLGRVLRVEMGRLGEAPAPLPMSCRADEAQRKR